MILLTNVTLTNVIKKKNVSLCVPCVEGDGGGEPEQYLQGTSWLVPNIYSLPNRQPKPLCAFPLATIIAPGVDTPMAKRKDLYLIRGRRFFSFLPWMLLAAILGSWGEPSLGQNSPPRRKAKKNHGQSLGTRWHHWAAEINQLQSLPTYLWLLVTWDISLLSFSFYTWSHMLLVAETILIDSVSQDIPSHLNSKPVYLTACQPFLLAVPQHFTLNKFKIDLLSCPPHPISVKGPTNLPGCSSQNLGSSLLFSFLSPANLSLGPADATPWIFLKPIHFYAHHHLWHVSLQQLLNWSSISFQ